MVNVTKRIYYILKIDKTGRGKKCGLRTADCVVRCAEKTECGGVLNFILTNSNINFCFLCQNMYFKYNMEYG